MRGLSFVLLIMAGLRVCAQGPDDYFTDSLQKRLAGAQTTREKVQFLMALSMTVRDSAQGEAYAGEALADAEMSRDRWLMAEAYLLNGNRYYNSHGLEGNLEKQEMIDYLKKLGYDFYLMQIKAAAFTEEGRYDSALYYFRLAEPVITGKGNTEVKTGFYKTFGAYYDKRKQYPEAIAYYQKGLALMAAAKDLENEQIFVDTLQRLYERAGDYRAALVYNRRAAEERDSLREKTQETELMKLEVETENRRKERVAREEQEGTERRHNIQYMGFTAGLVLLFLSIVLLGRLRVPVSVIRTVVFLSFIFLFEFIILLLDRSIQAWTHDEPWKVLCIKIVLAAGLVPLHHWLEHQVIHYLSHRHHRPAVAAAHKHNP